MLLDLSDILRGRKNQLDFSVEFELTGENLLDNHDYNFIDTVLVEGEVSRRRDELWIRLAYKSMVEFICDRCLENFEFAITGQLERKLSAEEGFDVEWLVIKKGSLDLAEVIVDDIVINLPIQLLCDEECAGLCPHCGINLNKADCNCGEDEIDPRLEGLKALLKN